MPSNNPNNINNSSDVNQYIPSFISKKPFYVDSTLSDNDYLEHQRLQGLPQDTLEKSKWYDRGRKAGPAATKFRKGACENCGAMTHKTKECLSRPRKQGAKWTGRDIQADEVVEDVKLGWDAKRDRWNGYDAREYSAVVQEYEDLEALKKAAAGGEQKQVEDGEEEGAEPRDLESDARYAEETDMGRNQPTSTRNLRIREDTAKYLVNLDLESAKYDPKTRSMATNLPDPSSDPSTSLADENFARAASDAAEFEKAQRYAWETQERDSVGGGTGAAKKLHLQANPTEGEILRKKQIEEAARKKETTRKNLLDKYGGAEYAINTSTLFRAAENERYVEYDEDGTVKGSADLKKIEGVARSKYDEDVLVNNHTAVWGSWWRSFAWGYACCHSMIRNSYCTGDEGRRGFEEAENLRVGEDLGLPVEKEENGDERGEGSSWRDQGEKTTKSVPSISSVAKKKRTLQEMRDGVTEEELDEFKRSRASALDPMANLLGRDEVVR